MRFRAGKRCNIYPGGGEKKKRIYSRRVENTRSDSLHRRSSYVTSCSARLRLHYHEITRPRGIPLHFGTLSRAIKGNPLNFNGAVPGKTWARPHFSPLLRDVMQFRRKKREGGRNGEIKGGEKRMRDVFLRGKGAVIPSDYNARNARQPAKRNLGSERPIFRYSDAPPALFPFPSLFLFNHPPPSHDYSRVPPSRWRSRCRPPLLCAETRHRRFSTPIIFEISSSVRVRWASLWINFKPPFVADGDRSGARTILNRLGD